MTSEGLQSNYDGSSFTPVETRKVFGMQFFCHQHNEIEQRIIDKSTNLDYQTKKLRLPLALEQNMKTESLPKLNQISRSMILNYRKINLQSYLI